jgi:hypothetical protein
MWITKQGMEPVTVMTGYRLYDFRDRYGGRDRSFEVIGTLGLRDLYSKALVMYKPL